MNDQRRSALRRQTVQQIQGKNQCQATTQTAQHRRERATENSDSGRPLQPHLVREIIPLADQLFINLLVVTQKPTKAKVSNQKSGQINTAQFKNWVSKIKTNNGDLIEVEFLNVNGVESVPNARVTAWDNNVYQWENFSSACAKKDFNRSENFSLIMSSLLLKDIENLQMNWTFSK